MESVSREAEVIVAGDNSVTVRYFCPDACGHCPIKEKCLSQPGMNREAQISLPPEKHFAVGDRVTISAPAFVGWLAVFFAYILPLLLFLAILLSAALLHTDETFAALSALAVLPSYYGVLWLYRKRMSPLLRLKIHKIGE